MTTNKPAIGITATLLLGVLFSPVALADDWLGTIESKPLEDMFPWLDREELRANMVVPVYRREARENA